MSKIMAEIEKGVPLPDMERTRYPFVGMEPGDSFFMSQAMADRAKLQAAASSTGRRYGWKMSVRKEGDGCRVWRIS